MSAIFDDILRRRNELEQKEQLRKRARYQNSYRQERSRRERAETRKTLDGDTLGVLLDFCQTAYPTMQVRTYEQGWSVGKWARAADGSLAWESIIDITLRYDNQDRPANFECRGHNRRILASLTPEALRQTLLRIYRPQLSNVPVRAQRKKR